MQTIYVTDTINAVATTTHNAIIHLDVSSIPPNIPAKYPNTKKIKAALFKYTSLNFSDISISFISFPVNCHEAKDFVASWDYTLMSISLPS